MRPLQQLVQDQRSRRAFRRVVYAAFAASLLTACLLTIDETKIGASPDDDEDDGSSETDATTSRPPVRDAEPSVETPDGARACSAGLTLCDDDICYDTTGDNVRCGSCTKSCEQNQVCIASKCVPPTSCKELLARAPGTPSGVTQLTLGGTAVPAFCDMTTAGGGWTLVFRVSQGIPGDVYGLFKGGPVNDTDAVEVTPQVRPKHYVSRALGDWNVGFKVDEVRARLYSSTAVQLRELAFDGKGSDRENWFSFARHVKNSSGWDLTGIEAGFFTAKGHEAEKRNFFVTTPYSTCTADKGWLVVHGTNTGTITCPYEQSAAANVRIYYSPQAAAEVWSDGSPENAASFAVFAR